MKKYYLLIILLLLAFQESFSQWSTSGNTISNTNSGYVGVGISNPLTRLHIVGGGSNIDGGNSYQINGDGLVIQANTGGRSSTTGAQLEFVIPAFTDGTNPWGQARIITVAGTGNNGDATGKMILGTRRSYNKLGVGVQWFYGNDITIDGGGNIGINTLTPGDLLDVNGYAFLGPLTERLSLGSGSLAFNRKVENGYIFDAGKFAYQFQHTGNTTAGSDYLALAVFNNSGGSVNNFSLVSNGSGQIGVNTNYIPSPYQMAVNGSVLATSVTVLQRSGWPDYVFKPSYNLPILSDVKTYVDQNHHLPEIPTAAEIAKNGVNLGDMNKLLLKKVEELTLYLIKQQQQIDTLQKKIDGIEKSKNLKTN